MSGRFVHAADLHIDSPLRGLDAYEDAPTEEIRGATRRAFDNLVSMCIEVEAQFLVLAGDLFDGEWRDYSTGLFFVNQVGRLAKAGVHTLIVRGNHDAQSIVQKSLQWPPGTKPFVHEFRSQEPETIHLEALGVALHGQSFRVSKVSDDLAAAYPAPVAGALNIGVLHTALEGRIGHAAYAPTTVATLEARGYDYWALGHVHAREVVRESPWVVFPGNLQGRHVRETGAKGASLVTFDGGRIESVEHRVLDVVRWDVVEVDLSESQEMDEVLALVQRSLTDAASTADGRLLAARIVLTGTLGTQAEPEAAERQLALFVELTEHPERLRDSVRAAAVELDVGDLWIEKVVTRVQRKRAPAARGLEALDPRALLGNAFAELMGSEELRAAALAKCFERLRTEPAELIDPVRERLGEDFLRSVEDLLAVRLDEAGS